MATANTRASPRRRRLNYSPVCAISLAPLTKIARFRRKSRALGRGIKRLHLGKARRRDLHLERARAHIPGIILGMAKMQFKTRGVSGDFRRVGEFTRTLMRRVLPQSLLRILHGVALSSGGAAVAFRLNDD